MERIEGLSIALDLDTARVDTGLKGLKSQMKTLSSEIKANMSVFDRADRSLERYETQVSGLNRRLELQTEITAAAREEHEKMVREHGEGSKQAEKAARAYNNEVAALNNLRRYVVNVRQELEDLREEQRISESSWGRMSQLFNDIGTSLTGLGGKMKEVGSSLSTSLSLPIVGLGAGITAVAANFENSSVKMQNSLGLTADEAKNLTNISRNLYKDGFGESTEEIDNALIETRQNITNLNKEDLQGATKNALLLADTFDSEVNEVTRAANSLMENYGLTSDKAFDLMGKGAQNGMNFSKEMFDNMAEYTTSFKEAGFSANEMFAILSNGSKKGYNLDRLNDTMLEFKLQSEDSGTGYIDAMSKMSKSTQNVFKQYKDGKASVSDLYKAVIPDLEKMKKTMSSKDFNTIGKSLFGTKWEDQGADVVLSMKTINKELENTDGTMDKMAKNVENSFGFRIKKVWRETQSAFMPIGEILLTFAESILPKVSAGIKKMSDFISGLSPAAQTASLIFAGLLAAIGPVITIIGIFAGAVGNIVTALSPMMGAISRAGGLLKWLRLGLVALTSPVGLIIGALALLGTGFVLLYKNSETFRNGVQNALNKLKELASQALTAIQPAIQAVIQFFKNQLAVLQKFWQENGTVIMQALTNIGNFIKATFNNVILPVIQFVMPLILGIIKSVWGNIQGIITGALNIIMGAVKFFSGLFTGNFSQMWAGIKQMFSGAVSFVWNLIQLQFIGKILKGIGGFVSSFGSTLKNGWSSAIGGIKTFAGNTKTWFKSLVDDGLKRFDDLVAGAKALPQKMGDGIKSMAGKAVDGVKSLGNSMASKLESIVNAITQDGINGILKKLGVKGKFLIPALNIPEYANGTDGHKGGLAVLGDGGQRELFITPQGGMGLSPATDTLMNLPKGTQVLSGENTKKALGSVPKYEKGTGFWNDIWSYVTNPKKLMTKLYNNLNLPTLHIGGAFGEIGKGSISLIKNKASDFVKGKLKELFKSNPVGASVERWRPYVLQALQMNGLSASLVDKVMSQIQSESGGNPKAINLWDSNAKAGHPSKGLMQTIDSTFNAYKFPGHNDIWNGFDNMLAALNYAKNRYGKNLSALGKGHGYATGGLINQSGLYNLAEDGYPEFVIPTDPKRRTDAMKLLALAGKQIQGNKRPNQLPNVSGDDYSAMITRQDQQISLMQQQVDLLTKLLFKDLKIDKDALMNFVNRNQASQTAILNAMKG